MKISEPSTMVTDYLMGGLAFWLALRLWRRGAGSGRRTRRWLAGALGALAVAAFLGGSAHGFALVLGAGPLAALWTVTELAVGWASFSLLVAAFHATVGSGWRRPALALAALQLAAYSVWMLGHDDFLWVIADYGSAMLVVAGLMVWRWRRPGARWIVAGIAVSSLAAIVQQSGLALHRHFNHNDLYHLIQMAALGLLYRGGAEMTDLSPEEAARNRLHHGG